MKLTRLDIEIKMLNGNVIQIDDISDISELDDFESILISKFKPVYAYSKIDAKDIPLIHKLENSGFQFSEFRLNSGLILISALVSFTPIRLNYYQKRSIFKRHQKCFFLHFADDRFSVDPMAGLKFSRERE